MAERGVSAGDGSFLFFGGGSKSDIFAIISIWIVVVVVVVEGDRVLFHFDSIKLLKFYFLQIKKCLQLDNHNEYDEK
jgi:hypothetical protein